MTLPELLGAVANGPLPYIPGEYLSGRLSTLAAILERAGVGRLEELERRLNQKVKPLESPVLVNGKRVEDIPIRSSTIPSDVCPRCGASKTSKMETECSCGYVYSPIPPGCTSPEVPGRPHMIGHQSVSHDGITHAVGEQCCLHCGIGLREIIDKRKMFCEK